MTIDIMISQNKQTVQRLADGSELRAAMGEVFVMENGLIKQRRAYVVPLQENDYR